MAFKRMLDKEVVPIDDVIKKHMIREAIQKHTDVIIKPVGMETSFYDCFTADKLYDNVYWVVLSYNINKYTHSIKHTLITKHKEVSRLCLNSLVNL